MSVPLDESPIVRPRVTEVEQHGIDTIPAGAPPLQPFDLFRIQFGGANTFATVILGTFPILLGLSLWQALAATVVGVLVGALFLMPMGLFGPLTGTNNAVSSGAHFGVRGRVVGSFLSLLTAIAFYSISVWVSGDAVVGALIRLFGISDSDLLRGVVYAILGAMVIVVVVYGYVFMLLVNKVVVVGNTVMILLGVLAYSGQIDLSYNPGPDAYALGSFWPTFVLSALIVMGNPISFGAFLGDWTRYIPERTKPSSLMLATLAAQAAHAGAVLLRGDHRDARRRGGRLHRRTDQRLTPLVRRAADRGRVPGRALHRDHLPLRHRPRLLLGVPALQPRPGVAVHRRVRVPVHPRRAAGLRPDRQRQRVHRRDRHLHDAVDDHHDASATSSDAPTTAPPTCRCSTSACAEARTGSTTGSTGAAWPPGSRRRSPDCCSPTTRP